MTTADDDHRDRPGKPPLVDTCMYPHATMAALRLIAERDEWALAAQQAAMDRDEQALRADAAEGQRDNAMRREAEWVEKFAAAERRAEEAEAERDQYAMQRVAVWEEKYAALRAENERLREALRHCARELQYVLDADPCDQAEIHQSGEGFACVALAESLLGPMRTWPEEPNASMSAALAEVGK